MTTQAQLWELSKKYESDPAIQAVRTSLQDSQIRARNSLSIVKAASDNLYRAVDFQEGFYISRDHSDFAAQAAKAYSALSGVASDLLLLAILLQAKGEDISY